MILQLKARHFKDANFVHPCTCAISLAANEVVQQGYAIEEWITEISVHNGDCHVDIFNHKHYGIDLFHKDYRLAEKAAFDDTVIRGIRIKGLEKYVNKGGNP